MMKLGSDSIGALVRAYGRGPFGLSFFMAWIYGAFYSSMVWGGSNGVLDAEYPWIASMLLSGLLGIAGCLAFGLRPPRALRSRSWAAPTAALLCGAGSLLVAWCSRAGQVEPLVVVLCVVPVAAGFSLLTVVWGSRIADEDDAMIEFSVPMSFIVARVLFALLVVLPPDAALALLVLLPLASTVFLRRPSGECPESAVSPSRFRALSARACDQPLLRVRGVVAATAVLLVFRIGYGVVRVVADGPATQGAWYFLSALLVPTVVFGVFVVLALTSARCLSSSLVTRWMLPVLLLAFALVPVDGEIGHQGAIMANSVASTILQAFFWLLLAKAAHRRSGSGPFFFSCYLVGLGIGMAVGEGLGLALVASVGNSELWLSLPFVACILVACVMALEERARRFGTEGEPLSPPMAFPSISTDQDAPDLIDAALREQAHRMAGAYKLSPREEEIVAHLLAGRNRPYIRDALFISLNTVNTHIKNAFAKMDVHSQQELLDVARAEFPIRLSS
ncbi:hypothetical protein H8S61_13885 [Eggerthella sp. NSJ-70]|uniref:HTH luxR-type domain-containing protein n=1 Tax=Eggerthella hominis TaxID=2763043 RepID=A0ABR7BV75_9ACTN|nr:LuxR C-terminal-related transcriptional regulator [Eggerthella hominis]MBC5585280.1 hypothetical protein [Eggerthella hominis]